MAKQEADEIAIIQGYLPKQMSDAEIGAAIDAAIKETEAAGVKDMGKVIGALKATNMLARWISARRAAW